MKFQVETNNITLIGEILRNKYFPANLSFDSNGEKVTEEPASGLLLNFLADLDIHPVSVTSIKTGNTKITYGWWEYAFVAFELSDLHIVNTNTSKAEWSIVTPTVTNLKDFLQYSSKYALHNSNPPLPNTQVFSPPISLSKWFREHASEPGGWNLIKDLTYNTKDLSSIPVTEQSFINTPTNQLLPIPIFLKDGIYFTYHPFFPYDSKWFYYTDQNINLQPSPYKGQTRLFSVKPNFKLFVDSTLNKGIIKL